MDQKTSISLKTAQIQRCLVQAGCNYYKQDWMLIYCFILHYL